MRAQQREQHPAGSSNRRRLAISIVSHSVALLVLAVPAIALHSGVKPFARLFFCDDESLAYPYKKDTVSILLAAFAGAGVAIATVLIVEGIRLAVGEAAGRNSTSPAVITGCLERCLSERAAQFVSGVLTALYMLVFGALCTELITQSAKLGFGRHRPYFLAACQLNVTTCQPGKAYSIDWCRAASSGSSAKALAEARMSFPSGHTSYSVFIATFLALYLQARLAFRHELHALKNVAQLALLLLAGFVAVSRVSDYRHHWSDVLGGAAIGGSVAALVSFKMAAGLGIYKPSQPLASGVACNYELLNAASSMTEAKDSQSIGDMP